MRKEIRNWWAEAFWIFPILIGIASPLLAFVLHFFPKAAFLLAGKDILVLALVPIVLIFGRLNRSLWTFLLFLPLILYAATSFLISEASLTAMAGSIRQLIMPVIFLLIGAYWGLDEKKLNHSKDRFKAAIWIFMALGVLFYLFPKPLLSFADVYFQYKSIHFNEWGYPGQWMEPIFGGIPRMASTFFDPVNWGHFLVFGLFYFFKKPRSLADKWAVFVLLLCLIASFCKGAWLQLMLVWLLAFSPFPFWLRILGYLGLPVFLFFASFVHPGVANHLLGLTNALKSISLFGYGIGSTGNVALLLNGKIEPFIFDTYLGAVLGQLGVFGALLWLFGWFGFVGLLYRRNKVLATVLLAQVFVSFYSENAFNFLSVFPICFFAGAEWAASKFAVPVVSIIDPVGLKAGMDYFSSHLAKALQKNGLKVFVLSNFENGPNYQKCFHAGFLPFWKKPLYIFAGYALAFFKLWKIGSDRVVLHCFKTTLTEAFIYKCLAILNIRIHLIVHDVESFDNQESKWLKYNLLTYFPQRVYCLNHFSRQLLENQLGHKRPILVIPHGHYLDLPNPAITMKVAREKLNLDPDGFYFLFFGQIKPVKGLDVLIKALKKSKNGRLIVAGQPRGLAMEEIERMSAGLGNRLEMKLGYISNYDRELYFKACDVVIVPYRKIYQSGVLLMALSYQKPVIASNLPPNLDVVNTENGWLFESENPEDLAIKMDTAFEQLFGKATVSSATIDFLERHYSWSIAAQIMAPQLNNPE